MRSMTINKRQFLRCILDIFVLLICYVPMGFGMQVVYKAKILACMILAVTIVGYCIHLLRGRKPNAVIVFILGIVIWNLLSTVLNGGDMLNALITLADFVTIPLYFLVFRCSTEKAMSTMTIWGRVLFCYVVFDLLTILIYPDGLYISSVYSLNWFLGYKTERMNIVLSMLILMCYQSIVNCNRFNKRTFISVFVAISDAFMCQGMTMVVAFLVLFFAYFVLQIIARRKTKLLLPMGSSPVHLFELVDIKKVLLVYAGIVFILLTLQVNPLVKTIAGWFGKDSSFSGRAHIWMVCRLFIKQSLLYGHGFVSSDTIKELTGFIGGTNAHNSVLTVLITGGIVGLVLYVLMLCYALQPRGCIRSKEYAILLSSEIAILISGLTSSIIVFQAVSLFPVVLVEYERCVHRQSIAEKEGKK